MNKIVIVEKIHKNNKYYKYKQNQYDYWILLFDRIQLKKMKLDIKSATRSPKNLCNVRELKSGSA